MSAVRCSTARPGSSASLRLSSWHGSGRLAPAPSAPLQEDGSLARLIKDYKAHLPGAGSHAYVDPSPEEVHRVVAAVVTAQRGDREEAVARLDILGYDLVCFEDNVTESPHLILRERTPCIRCWGLYVLNLAPRARNVVVEAPHPLHDRFTPELGIAAYLRLDARAFLMAGAHRYANGYGSLISDMARNPGSVFQGLHEALIDSATHVLQVHGFTRPDYAGYPSVLLSNGSAQPNAELFDLQTALEMRGETAGVYDGERWRQLGGLPNPQGRHTRMIGGRFYHMEHDAELRRDPTRRAAIVDALTALLGCDDLTPQGEPANQMRLVEK